MNNEDWQKVETIFHHALNLDGADRRDYLARNCSGDFSLLNEVESLIEAFEDEAEFLENPVSDLSLKVVHEKTQKTRTDAEIGIYKIGAKLGSGGMGEVYEAVDTTLNRKVALKFLSESLKTDNSAKKQLHREAQAVAMLEHPNICGIYGIEQIGDDTFIVMQFIEGATLEKNLESICVDADSFKPLANQIVGAVGFAHSHGVIHRDLKPGNIMLSNDENIKVLDFGLAKIIEQPKIFDGKLTGHSVQLSQNGLIIGTVAYMSPEQLRGEKLNYQTDIFSLGIILYEMLAKQNPFRRATQVETIAAILSDNSISAEKISPRPSPNIVRLIDKCLKKDKSERFQSVAEILVELDKLGGETFPSAFAKRRRNFLTAAVLSVVVFCILGLSAFYYAPSILSGTKQKRSLAVLPIGFDPANSDKEYLANGLTQSIIENLSGLSAVKVENEDLVSQFKGQEVEPQTAGKKLGVDLVFTGKIIKKENGTFLETKLIRASDNFVLSSDELILDENKLNELQDAVTSKIIDKTVPTLTLEERRTLAKKDTENSDAKKLYFLGRFCLNRRKDDDLIKAIQYFQEATSLDPLYAKAWAGLADTYSSTSLPGYKSAISPEESIKLARAAAKSAIEIDDTLAEPYISLGMIKLKYEWEWQEAENYFKAAAARDRESAPAYLGLASLYNIEGRFDESLQQAQKAKEYAPFAVSSDSTLALCYYYRRDYQKMSAILLESLARNPDHKRLRYLLGLQLIEAGKMTDAAAVFEKIYAEDKSLGAAPLGFIYGKTGRKTDAVKILSDLDALAENNYVSAQERAFIYLGIGDRDKVFENLNRACQEKFTAFPGIVYEPMMDEIKSDPKFEDIKKCANL